jgi:hypothetical protein
MEINIAWKGTKAEPFLIKLKEYFQSTFSPEQVIYKIMKKFGKPQKERKDEKREKIHRSPHLPYTSSMDMGYPPPMGVIPGQMGGFNNFEISGLHHSLLPQCDEHMQLGQANAFHNFIRGGTGGRGFPFRGRGFLGGQWNSHQNYDRDNSSSSNSSDNDFGYDEENKDNHRHQKKRHSKHKRHKNDPEFLEQERIKKWVVVSEHQGFQAGHPNSFVDIELVIENQSNRWVPSHTYILKADDNNPIIFEPMDLFKKILKNQSRNCKITVQLPTQPGEYTWTFKFMMRKRSEIGTRFDLSFLVYDKTN